MNRDDNSKPCTLAQYQALEKSTKAAMEALRVRWANSLNIYRELSRTAALDQCEANVRRAATAEETFKNEELLYKLSKETHKQAARALAMFSFRKKHINGKGQLVAL
jgi:hypothetical protein